MELSHDRDDDDHHKSYSSSDSDRHEDDGEIKLSGGDMQIVMGRLGFIDYEFEGEVGEKELINLFEEQEPSLEELKQAFNVFDVNKDGFIDETELHRVLSCLNLIHINEGSKEVENCRRMIKAVDCNGDGRIDFDEFVTCMNKCFS